MKIKKQQQNAAGEPQIFVGKKENIAMLKVRKDQMTELNKVSRITFENKMMGHFSQIYPCRCENLGKKQLRKVIRYGTKQAQSYGYETQKQLAYYISLMLILGSDFDKDSQYPWVIEKIDAANTSSPLNTIQNIYQSTIVFLEKTVGNESQYFKKVLLKLKKFKLNTISETSESQFEEDMIVILKNLYPQKFEFLGRRILHELVSKGVEAVKDYGFTTNKAKSFYVIAMFLIGSAFDRDPQFPWAKTILTELHINDENTKIEQLHHGLLNSLHIEFSNSSISKE